jgi:hypothetical protein
MKKTLLTVAATLVAVSGFTRAAWTTLDLPDNANYGNTAMTHLADGRFIYGHSGSMIIQDAFGSNATTGYASAPAGDYAFLTSKYNASGAWGGGPIRTYDSGNLSSAFTTIRSAQTYAGINYGASGMLLIGTNGGNSDLGYLTESNAYTTLIDGISTYSGGFTLDGAGNLYLADDDDQGIYRFDAAEILAAVGGTPLTMADGTLITNLGVSGSLAFDDTENRLYAAGWQINGIRVFDLDTSESGTILPGAANSNYQVSTFSDGSNSYVGWLNRDGWMGGDAVVYGYDLVSSVAIPEPSALALLALGGTGLLLLCRRGPFGPALAGPLECAASPLRFWRSCVKAGRGRPALQSPADAVQNG